MSDERVVVELFFDIGSPYSYLAATQMADLSERTGAEVRWRPFLLGGVFKATGNEMPARVPAKARWMVADLHDWASLYEVPFVFPTALFPKNTLLAQRALTAAPAPAVPMFALALFGAFWVEGRDPSDSAVVRACADAVGLDGAAILAASGEPEIKAQLRATTEDAIARGAFGAPTFFVGDRMFWGNDRIGLIEALLAPDAR